MRLYFFVLILFVVLTFFFGKYGWILPAVEIILILALLIYSIMNNRKRRDKLVDYIESVADNVDTASKDSLSSFPVPVVIYNINDGLIVWSNSRFHEITEDREHVFEVSMTDVAPGYDGKWLAEGKRECAGLTELNGKKYKIYGSIIRGERGRAEREFMAVTYWVDVTEFADTYEEYVNSRPVAAVILLDNYDELLKNLTEKDKSALLSAIDDRVSGWVDGCHGYLTKADRDRYLYLFEARYLQRIIDEKFSLLDSVRTLTGSGGIHATVSIGIGKDAADIEEAFRFASLSIEMALSRGGDQAVIKNKYNFEFFGGHTAEQESGTKVKSRVMASAFSELLREASGVLIMGHKYADLDTVGAAAGICCAARALGKPAHIVLDLNHNAAGPLVERLQKLPEYAGVFSSTQEAILSADSKTLLVVVDTNRPAQVESESLLISCNRVAVIDHHRRAADYISNPDLSFHEPHASSASELVSEMLQYIIDPSEILPAEAEALLSGIVLDTKSFTIRTGGRTFDAAAYLQRAGADTTSVKTLLQSDMAEALARYSIISEAADYGHGIATAVSDTPSTRVIIAQAADELLNITGISASFALAPCGDGVSISGRSIGDTDVQQILERLGGGGNRSTAGVQLTGITPQEAYDRLCAAIDDYINYAG